MVALHACRRAHRCGAQAPPRKLAYLHRWSWNDDATRRRTDDRRRVEIPVEPRTSVAVSEGISNARLSFRTEQAQRVRAPGQSIDRRRAEIDAAGKDLVVVSLSRLADGVRNEQIELAIDPAAKCDTDVGNRLTREIKKGVCGGLIA